MKVDAPYNIVYDYPRVVRLSLMFDGTSYHGPLLEQMSKRRDSNLE